MPPLDSFNHTLIACRKCPRLVAWREQVAVEKRRAYQDWDYWGKPVPGFGDAHGRVLVVGLAPGAHGSNRTGRMFTGDSSGVFLYRALHRAGFASQPTAHSRDDGLVLHDLYISAVCRCAPPKNKPSAEEVVNCRPYLAQELTYLPNIQVVVALGRLAYDNMHWLYAVQWSNDTHFAHNRAIPLGAGLPTLVASFHPSQQNTQTGRLTEAMFDEVWQRVTGLLK